MNPCDNEWQTKDGTIIKIASMTDSHLHNAIRFVRRLIDKFTQVQCLQEPDGDMAADAFEVERLQAQEAGLWAADKLEALLFEAKRRRWHLEDD